MFYTITLSRQLRQTPIIEGHSMSAENVSTNSSKGIIFVILIVGVLFSGLIYLFEFSPAKSWNVKSLAECALSLENKKNASLIMDQVSENPRIGKVNRLTEKCRNLREDEKLIHANELVAYAKASLKNN